MLAVVSVALWFTLSTSAAHAGPVIGAVFSIFTALGGSAFGGTLLRLAIGIGLSYFFRPKPKAAGGAIGISSGVQGGGVVPRSFMLGKSRADGSIVYRNSFGTAGDTQNAYYVQVLALEDLPVNRLIGLIIDEVTRTYNPVTTPGPDGIALPDFTVNGKEHLWVRFYDGTQTTADARLVSLFGADANRPYTSAMIGTGIAYLIVTSLVNPGLFSGYPRVSAVLEGLKLYDRRRDTTAGGLGHQRYANPSTWGYTKNPVTMIETILKGIRYNGQWFFGAQTVEWAQIPFGSASAAASECDANDAVAGGGTEAQFEAGGEIRLDQEPADVIDELLKSCNGKLAEIGGRYKFRVGAAGAAVFSFTDADILSTDKQSFEPFPALEQTVNGVTAKFVGIQEGYKPKDAPALFNAAYEAADDGRRLIADVAYGMVHSPSQTQRLMRAEVRTQRMFRMHQLPMPPEFYALEPLDVVAWGSDRNGYPSNKTFDILSIDDLPNLNQAATLRELNPNAYDWDANTDEQATEDHPGVKVPVPVQSIIGFFAEGYAIPGVGLRLRAGIRLGWDPNKSDVRGVRYQVRLASTQEPIGDDSLDDDDLAVGSIVISQNIIGNTAYEVRAKYLPASARTTAWSNWLAVTTPDVRIPQADLDNALDALIRQINRIALDNSNLREDVDLLSSSVNSQFAKIGEGQGQIRLSVGSRYLENKAGIELALVAQTSASAALAAIFGSLFAISPTGEATTLFRFIAASAPAGVLASFAIQVRATNGEDFADAGLFIDAGVTDLGGASRIRLVSDSIVLENPLTGLILDAFLFVVADVPLDSPLQGASIRPDLRTRQMIHKTVLTHNGTFIFPLGAKPGFQWVHYIQQDAVGGHALSQDGDVYIDTLAAPDSSPNAISVYDGAVIDTAPALAVLTLRGKGNTNLSTVRRFSIASSAGGAVPGGKTLWDLDDDGVLTLGPGTYTIRPLGNFLQCSVDLRGPGGSTGGFGNTSTDGGLGTNSTFQGMIARAGGRTLGLDVGVATGAKTSPGGIAGTASGGTTNTNGTAGEDGTLSGASGGHGGFGAAAPSGGAQVVNIAISFANQVIDGTAGNPPGGGAAGGAVSATSTHSADSAIAIGGGGSGARTVKAFGSGALVKNTSYILVVGKPGTRGTGVGNAGYGPFGDFRRPCQGKTGGLGRAIIT